LPAPAFAADGCQSHCHCRRGRKPLPPAPCSFRRSRFIALIAIITVAVALTTVFVSLSLPSLCRRLLLLSLMPSQTLSPSPLSSFLSLPL
jgi:hypothetical protein